MIKTVIVVRHGHYDKAGLTDAEKKEKALSPLGRVQVDWSGRFLREQGLRPDYLMVTRTRRTQETGERVCQQLGVDLEPCSYEAGFNKVQGLDNKIAYLESKYSTTDASETALLCVHHTAQQVCAKLPGAPMLSRKIRGATFVLRRDGGIWQCVTAYPTG